jgi:CTP:molybdopterin cytidylyltransferase MocA
VTGAVILAAGAGSRLGGVAKALLVHQGRTFLEHIARLVSGPCVVVVAEPFRDEVTRHARSLELVVVDNPAPERGMASSVALGFTAAQGFAVDAAYLWPVDHPFVQPSTLVQLEATPGLARPTYRGRGGHPPRIPRALWGRFATCDQTDGGARAVMATLDVTDVPVDDPGVVRDVDTPADREAR